tara:strand:- start:691 stop:1260 length:570 start_codon:yes stop_codon:yes gene_type:complete
MSRNTGRTIDIRSALSYDDCERVAGGWGDNVASKHVSYIHMFIYLLEKQIGPYINRIPGLVMKINNTLSRIGNWQLVPHAGWSHEQQVQCEKERKILEAECNNLREQRDTLTRRVAELEQQSHTHFDDFDLDMKLFDEDFNFDNMGGLQRPESNTHHSTKGDFDIHSRVRANSFESIHNQLKNKNNIKF